MTFRSNQHTLSSSGRAVVRFTLHLEFFQVGMALKAVSWSLPRVYTSPRAGGFTRRNVSLAHRIGEKCGRISTVDARVRAAPVSSLTTSPHISHEEKGLLVERLLKAKAASGKTYDEIADKTGLTNAYVAQLFLNQAQLRPSRIQALRQTVPALSDQDIEHMQRCPYRSFDDSVKDEPLVYRLLEAVLHYGQGLKSIVNEKFGDGIMSAIDFFVTVEKIEGAQGEDRVVITFNGKFLPHVEQTKEEAAAGLSKK